MADAANPRLNLVTTPFRLKGTSLPATLMQPNTDRLHLLETELKQRLAKGNSLLKAAPLVVELKDLESFNLRGFQKLCTDLGIQLVAIRSADSAFQSEAKSLGLMALNTQERPLVAANQEELGASKVYEGSVRSGQQLVHEKGDLIVLGSVNPGGEVLASGQIHVYGALRGRALAGIHGDVQARIFTLGLKAELVAIAGHYQTSLDSKAIQTGEAVCIALQDEKLVISKLSGMS
ncbi:septum site-determining protein MinC [Marinospirillum celere]|uniref:Probable septum site-determining protein MinC n=1 Tax=Marinospirillum celere TaxID=1122252 RepID=A0A1I1JND9_9GAMM|nr:septum site-determining protein MinC [Marinospirillum celere]SFC49996.1 septum site-determining protein MinC [Marinospirillum celere]